VDRVRIDRGCEVNYRSMVPIEVVQYARRVLGSVRRIRLSESPSIDILDRLGLLTLASGLRNLAAFGFAETNNRGSVEELGGVLSAQGLHCLITSPIRPRSNEFLRDTIGDLFKIFDYIDAESYSRRSEKLLWVFRDSQQEEQVTNAVERTIEVGTLLGYPACCVERHELILINHGRAFASAIVAAVGEDPSAVERALREDLKVEIPDDSLDHENMRRSDELVPFVFHVACDACLSSDKSPSAEQNRDYEKLAQQYDRAFHHWFRQLRKTDVQIEHVIEEAETQGFRPAELEGPLKTRLEGLLAERGRIHSQFF
jgi:hypothetical protein